MKDFISLLDYSTAQLTAILDRADALAAEWRSRTMPRSLAGARIGLWFYGQGFRNRAAFELGARAMGAEAVYVPGELGVHEPLEDIGAYLSNWFDLLVVRSKRREDLIALSRTTGASVIDARTDRSHPCEIMGDLQFLRRERGSLEGLKVVFVGENTNLCMSWLEAAARFPIHVTQVAPEGCLADKSLLDSLSANAAGTMRTSGDMGEIDGSVDLVYTDCWPKADGEEERARIRDAFLPYQVRTEHLARLKEGASFLPCPPVTRGEEISAEAMASPLCHNARAKEYLLHAQNAIMEMLWSARKGKRA